MEISRESLYKLITNKYVLAGGAGLFTAVVAAYVQKKLHEYRVKAAIAVGGSFVAHLTTYYPLAAKTAAQRAMEGGTKAEHNYPIYYLEDAREGKSQYCTVSGDNVKGGLFPFGQKLHIDGPEFIDSNGNPIDFRVTDTGGNFHGSGKVYRVAGAEPLDIAVRRPNTKIPSLATVHAVRGDDLMAELTPTQREGHPTSIVGE